MAERVLGLLRRLVGPFVAPPSSASLQELASTPGLARTLLDPWRIRNREYVLAALLVAAGVFGKYRMRSQFLRFFVPGQNLGDSKPRASHPRLPALYFQRTSLATLVATVLVKLTIVCAFCWSVPYSSKWQT